MFNILERRAWERKTKHGLRVKEHLASDADSLTTSPKKELRKIVEKFRGDKSLSRNLEKVLIKLEKGQKLTSRELAFLVSSNITPRFSVRNWSDLRKLPKSYYIIGENIINTKNLNLSDLNLKSVKLGFRNTETTGVDLESRTFNYYGDINIKINKGGQNVDTCSSCEDFFKRIFSLNEEYRYRESGRGIVLKLAGKTVGVVKMKGERSFLATRTVKDREGRNLLIKGMVYGLPENEIQYLQSIRIPENNPFPSVNIETFADDLIVRFRQQRFIYDKNIFDYLDTFTDSMDLTK